MHDAIVSFMQAPNGGRRRVFSVGPFTVMVEPHEDDASQEAFTRQLAGLCGVVPRDKTELLGPGYVRAQGDKLWLLGHREKGFAAFGYPVTSWDELFAIYAVRPGEHGCDEPGEDC